jgi:(E)-4-hydroxy-3-methylbut-2-enyl-diphosphate synthase
VDGVKTVTLKGDNIALEFQKIVERYVADRYAKGAVEGEAAAPKAHA